MHFTMEIWRPDHPSPNQPRVGSPPKVHEANSDLDCQTEPQGAQAGTSGWFGGVRASDKYPLGPALFVCGGLACRGSFPSVIWSRGQVSVQSALGSSSRRARAGHYTAPNRDRLVPSRRIRGLRVLVCPPGHLCAPLPQFQAPHLGDNTSRWTLSFVIFFFFFFFRHFFYLLTHANFAMKIKTWLNFLYNSPHCLCRGLINPKYIQPLGVAGLLEATNVVKCKHCCQI